MTKSCAAHRRFSPISPGASVVVIPASRLFRLFVTLRQRWRSDADGLSFCWAGSAGLLAARRASADLPRARSGLAPNRRAARRQAGPAAGSPAAPRLMLRRRARDRRSIARDRRASPRRRRRARSAPSRRRSRHARAPPQDSAPPLTVASPRRRRRPWLRMS